MATTMRSRSRSFAGRRGVDLPPLNVLRTPTTKGAGTTLKPAEMLAGDTLESSPRYYDIINPPVSPLAARPRNRPARSPDLVSDSATRRLRESLASSSKSRSPTRSGVAHAGVRSTSPTSPRRARAAFGAGSASEALREPLRVEKPNSMGTPKNTAQDMKARAGDLLTRAKACRRAGRFAGEAAAFYNLGALYEQKGDIERALNYYHKHLALAKQCDDRPGRALACNSIGALLQHCGRLHDAQPFHRAHLALADVRGRFVAHTNLGSVLARLNMHEEASEHHQHALRYAIRMASASAQAIAIANVGAAGDAAGDLYTAKACAERFLAMSSEANDLRAQSTAYERLGAIATKQGLLKQACEYYRESMKTARFAGDMKNVAKAKVFVGVAAGDMAFEAKMKAIRENVEKESRENSKKILQQQQQQQTDQAEESPSDEGNDDTTITT